MRSRTSRWVEGPDELGRVVLRDAADDAHRRPRVRRRHGRRRRALHQQHQRRARLRLREGREDPPHHPHRVRRRRCRAVDHHGPGPDVHPAPQDHGHLPHARLEVDDLLPRPAPLPDEAGGLRPEGRAEPAEPRHVRLRTHQLGRGARHRRRGDQAGQARARPRRHPERQRLPPHLGHPRLLAERPSPLLQQYRLDPGRAQPGQLGRLVLGGHAPLGTDGAQRRRRELRHGGGLPQGMRDGRLLVERPGSDERRLRRLRRHHPAPVAQGAGHPLVHIDPYYNHTAALLGGKWLAPRPATDNAMVLAIAYVWITEGLYDKEYVADRTTASTMWKAYILGEEDGIPKTPEWQEARDGHPREGRARPRPRVGYEEDLSRRRRPLRVRQRLPHGDRQRLGPLHGLPHGHAGAGQTRRQHGLPAAGHADRHALLLPRLRRGRLLGRHRRHRLERQPVPAHAPARHGQHGLPGRAAPARSPRPSWTASPRATSPIPRPSKASSRRYEYPAPGHSPVKMYYKYGGSHIGTMADATATPACIAPTTSSSSSTSPSGSRARRSSPTSSCRPAPTSSAGTSASSPTAAATSSTASTSATTGWR